MNEMLEAEAKSGIHSSEVTPASSSADNRSLVSAKNEPSGHEEDSPIPKESDGKDAGGDEEENEHPSSLRLALLTFGVSLVVFVVALDNTIIATAIPTITTVFNSLDDVGWYGSVYLLTTTGLQPSYGKLYSTFNVKYIYLAAIVIFEVGSIICAVAKSSNVLILGRAVAGAGSAGLFSGGMTIIGLSAPPRKAPLYLSSLGAMYGIASIVGPIMGGVFTDKVTWRWCFWINLPFGGIAFLAVLVFFRPPKRKDSGLTFMQKMKQIDLYGAALLFGGICCLLLALQWGGTTRPWSSPRVWGLLLGFGLISIVFSVLQWHRGDQATIPPRLLRQRTVLVSSIFAFVLYMGFYTHVYYLPFYFQAVKGATAEASGIRTIPYLVSFSTSAITTGVIITKTGHFVPLMWIGAVFLTVGSGALFTLKVNTSTAKLVGFQILGGIGVGLGAQSPFNALPAILKKEDIPSGNAILLFSLSLGGTITISIAQSILTNSLITEIPKHTTGVDPHLIVTSGATAFRRLVPQDQVMGIVESYMKAINMTFILPIAAGVAAVVVSLFTEWRQMPKAGGSAGAA